MSLWKSVCCGVLVTVFFGSSATAAINWNITGAGARAEGMAGAFIGVADDATSVVWNPAGLATLERPEASVVNRFVSNSFESDYVDDQYDQTSSDNHYVLNFISGAFPVQLADERKLVLALALQRQIDTYSEDRDGSSKGGASTISPGLGFHMNPVLSLGATANIWMGKTDGEGVADTTPYDWEEKFSGFNLGLGVLADLQGLENPMPLRLGLSLRLPFKLNVDVSNTLDPNQYNTSGITKVEMPLMIGVGASWRIGEFFTLAFDLENRAYGKSKVKTTLDEPPTGGGEYIVENKLSWSEKDLFQYRVGVEYLLVTDIGVIPLRGGFRNMPTTFADINYDPVTDDLVYGDQTVGFGFSLGTGYIHERFSIDLTWSHSSYEWNWEWFVDDLNSVEKTSTSTITLSGIIYY